MVKSGVAFCIAGNHDAKLWRKLSGRDVKIAHGLAQSLEQLEKESPQFNEDVKKFLSGLSFHYLFDDGKLVIAHAGLKEHMHGRLSERIRSFALYGETSGEVDGFGLPIRYNWAAKYHGKSLVVYGHVPVPEAEWINNTVCIDTGCVFGGSLTALRYPEKEIVFVKAQQTYFEPSKPLLPIAQMPIKPYMKNE
jgi:protein phosphatase